MPGPITNADACDHDYCDQLYTEPSHLSGWKVNADLSKLYLLRWNILDSRDLHIWVFRYVSDEPDDLVARVNTYNHQQPVLFKNDTGDAYFISASLGLRMPTFETLPRSGAGGGWGPTMDFGWKMPEPDRRIIRVQMSVIPDGYHCRCVNHCTCVNPIDR
jgi:hypothetical protein